MKRKNTILFLLVKELTTDKKDDQNKQNILSF